MQPLPMSSSDRFAPTPGLSRNAVIILSVVLFHAVALWALQTGLLRRAAEIVIPAQVLAEFVTPPAPEAKEPPPPAQPPPKPMPRQPVVRQQARSRAAPIADKAEQKRPFQHWRRVPRRQTLARL